jgi:acyl-CoA hydrolase
MTEVPEHTPDATLRVRLGANDTHYRGNVIPAATTMRLFADCCTQITTRNDGQGGLLAAYEGAEFLHPLFIGDFVELRAWLLSTGNRSRRMTMVALRTIRAPTDDVGSRPVVCDPPEIVARATIVVVIPK